MGWILLSWSVTPNLKTGSGTQVTENERKYPTSLQAYCQSFSPWTGEIQRNLSLKTPRGCPKCLTNFRIGGNRIFPIRWKVFSTSQFQFHLYWLQPVLSNIFKSPGYRNVNCQPHGWRLRFILVSCHLSVLSKIMLSLGKGNICSRIRLKLNMRLVFILLNLSTAETMVSGLFDSNYSISGSWRKSVERTNSIRLSSICLNFVLHCNIDIQNKTLIRQRSHLNWISSSLSQCYIEDVRKSFFVGWVEWRLSCSIKM